MTVKGQVTVPKELRAAFGWKAGGEVEFMREKDGVAAAADVLAVNPIIYAELSVGFAAETDLAEALASAGFRRLPLPYHAGWPAARAFSAYWQRGGRGTAPLPDFFIGAHAHAENLRLLTREAARIRTHLPKVDPIGPG